MYIFSCPCHPFFIVLFLLSYVFVKLLKFGIVITLNVVVATDDVVYWHLSHMHLALLHSSKLPSTLLDREKAPIGYYDYLFITASYG